MRRFVMRVLLLAVLAMGYINAPAAAIQPARPIDLANVPLPTQALPESGFQVMTGAYLNRTDTVRFVADARGLLREYVDSQLTDIGPVRAYVLDLVLPEDRADAGASILAVVQTSVYEVDSVTGAEELAQILSNYEQLDYVEQRESPVDDAVSVSFVGEGGDSIRTVMRQGNVVVEIVSMDATGQPDSTEHDLIVEATAVRLDAVTQADQGISSSALQITPSIDFANAEQTGFHGLYRFRDGQIQPALGELGAENLPVPEAVSKSYVSSFVSPAGVNGIALTSIWITSYVNEDEATVALEAMDQGNASDFADPFFDQLQDEAITVEAEGQLRVTGTLKGDPYSGYIRFEQRGTEIIVIAYRAVGSTLPNAGVVDSMMSQQLACLESATLCKPFELSTGASNLATPTARADAIFESPFGWMVSNLGPEWNVTDQMSESGYDMVELRHGQSLFMLESVINHHGEPVQCVLDELHNLQDFEEHADIRLWKDADGATEAGSEDGHAWSTYRVEPLSDERADQEYVTRIDCYSIPTAGANLIVTQIAPVDDWETERDAGDELRDTVSIPLAMRSHGSIAVSTYDRRTAVIHFPWIDRAA